MAVLQLESPDSDTEKEVSSEEKRQVLNHYPKHADPQVGGEAHNLYRVFRSVVDMARWASRMARLPKARLAVFTACSTAGVVTFPPPSDAA